MLLAIFNEHCILVTVMSEERLKEGGGTGLTMALIGCLPDNVQKVTTTYILHM